MWRRFRFTYKIIITFLLFTIIYNEYICYKLNSSYWTEIKCENEKKCVKILLVADPQLIGEKNEVIHSITPFSIFDSDRYLRNSYALAVDHLKPDVVIFLGDLLDEGSIANAIQFNRYLRRLFNIFPTHYPIKHIWLPGDNDIGGETERITDYKVNRFNHAFSQPSIINVKHITFTKVNRMLPETLQSTIVNTKQGYLSIVVSHMPLIQIPGVFVDKVIEVIKPKLIFAAHEHKSRLIETNFVQDHRRGVDLNEHNKIYNYKLNNEFIYEIIVPTCSYRMGANHVGYGAAVIEGNDTLHYSILWSPDRFLHLYIYFFVCVMIVVFILLQIILSFINKRSKYGSPSKPNYMYHIIKNGV